MRIRTVTWVLGSAIAAALVTGASVIRAQSANEKVVETKAEVSRGTPPVKLKSESRVNSKKAAPIPAPAQKGGEKARGQVSTCIVHFDNRTDLWIKGWVDGEFEGVTPPYGDLYAYAIAGGTQLFARADFDDGTYLYWGPTIVSCPPGGTFTWRVSR